MKKYLTIFFAIVSTTIFGQATNHFNHNGALWLVADTYPNPSPQEPSFVETKTYAYASIGDTNLAGQNWKIMVQANDSSLILNPIIVGFTRKQGPRIYFMDTMLQQDTLYDFSLQVDDYFGFNLPNGLEYLRVKKIDTVQIQGDLLKRFFFDEPDVTTIFSKVNEVWIENIGSMHGPLFPYSGSYTSTEFSDSTTLTCTYQITTSFYVNPNYEECINNRILNLDTELERADFKVFPNPSEKEIFVQSELPTTIEILDYQGRIVLIEGTNKKFHQFKIQHLPAGIYTVNLNIEGSIYHRRFMKF